MQGGAGHGRSPVPSCVKLGSCIPDRGLCKAGGCECGTAPLHAFVLNCCSPAARHWKSRSVGLLKPLSAGLWELPALGSGVFLPSVLHVLTVKLEMR